MIVYSRASVGIKKMACQADWNNHANQLNPNNHEYWHSREEPSDDDTGACGYPSSSSDEDEYNYFQEDFDSVIRSASVSRQQEEMSI